MARRKGVLLTFTCGAEMHIATKDQKESLKFEMTSSRGLSGSLSGLIGYSIRPCDYHIDADSGVITVEGREIQNAKRTWMDHSYCYVLTGPDVFTFLGQTIDAFSIPNAHLIEEVNPK